jgi:lipopolysaccharide transport system permease protein
MVPSVVYESNQRAKMGWIRTWVTMVRDIILNRELIYQLWRRDFLMMYKKSFFGMGWLIIAPVMGIISWVFMNATGVLTPGDIGVPYPAYILLSTTIWGLFMNFYTGSSQTLQIAQGFITQVNFPHHVLLIKQALQQLGSFVISFIISILILVLLKVNISWMTLLIPLFILPLFFIASAIGLFVSIITIVTPDLQRVFTFVMGLLLFITPVIYSSNVDSPLLQIVIKWNPLTYLIGGVRDAIFFGHIEHLNRYLISTLISLFLFLILWRLFYISEEKVIEKML